LYDQEVSAFRLESLLPPDATTSEVDAAVDRQLTTLFFAGATLKILRYRLFGVVWHFATSKKKLPMALSTFNGFRKMLHEKVRDPSSWEETLLRARYFLDNAAIADGPDKAAATLLAFDTYARMSPVLALRPRDLQPPQSTRGPLRCWSVTFCPADTSYQSKTGTQDDTVSVGQTCSRRMWVNRVVEQLAKRSTPTVFNFTMKSLEVDFARSSNDLQLPSAVPHMLRHGGPSMDAATEDISDMTLQNRGMWACATSVVRYRKPGKYMRRLALLSADQMTLALAASLYLEQNLPKRICLSKSMVRGVPERKIKRKLC
jgi:hypothetical protein